MPFATNLQSLLGLLALALLAALLAPRASGRTPRSSFKTAAAGQAVQLLIKLIILKLPPVRFLFATLNEAVGAYRLPPRPGRRSSSAISAADRCLSRKHTPVRALFSHSAPYP